MKYIVLSNGMMTAVDDEDYERLSHHTWAWAGHYAARAVRSNGRQKKIYLHREILGAAKNVCVDHVSGDVLDNRRANLRIATKSQNGMNRGAPSSNTSGYKGVYFHKAAKKWAAEITVNYKKYYLGLHDSPKAAHRAYCRAAAEYHGDFSNHGKSNQKAV